MPTKRIGSLRKIAKLYGAVEQMHQVALRQAAAAVDEAEKAIGAERASAHAAHAAARTALHAGDDQEWMLADTRGQVARLRIEKVESLRVARVESRDERRTELLASRLRTEQMKRVVDTMVERVETEESRRLQAASDDRYLARMHWCEAKSTRRLSPFVKVS